MLGCGPNSPPKEVEESFLGAQASRVFTIMGVSLALGRVNEANGVYNGVGIQALPMHAFRGKAGGKGPF